MLKTIEQLKKFRNGIKRKGLNVRFAKGHKHLGIKTKKGYWIVIPISDEIHNYLSQIADSKGVKGFDFVFLP